MLLAASGTAVEVGTVWEHEWKHGSWYTITDATVGGDGLIAADLRRSIAGVAGSSRAERVRVRPEDFQAGRFRFVTGPAQGAQ
jgi:hypothetical protein